MDPYGPLWTTGPDGPLERALHKFLKESVKEPSVGPVPEHPRRVIGLGLGSGLGLSRYMPTMAWRWI